MSKDNPSTYAQQTDARCTFWHKLSVYTTFVTVRGMKAKVIRYLLAAAFVSSLVFSEILPSSQLVSARAEPARGEHGMVASQHELASRIGVEIMQKGGNAVDAAIAVGLALAVVYPEAGNIGGGGFMLIHEANGLSHFIDYREKAPRAATPDMYIDRTGELLKGEGSSTVGYRAAGVPGTLAGFEMAFRKYGSGRIKWHDLVEPARLLAQNGHALSHRVTELFKSYKDTLSGYDDSRKIFLNGGQLFFEGDLLRQPELANTLCRIEKNGSSDFYRGTTGKMIAKDMKSHGGLITFKDLQDYRAVERDPVHGNYRGFEIISAPPPSSGGIVLLEALNILEGYDLHSMQPNSAMHDHLLTEAMRRAFADRAEFMGDPDFTKVPVASLIDKLYAARRRSTIKLTHASTSKDIGHGEIAGSESTDTTHFTVVDVAGNVVTNTYTLNDLFGSRVTAKGTGVLLNDEMDDFTARPGKPNLYGLIQGERNSVQGSKRPLSSMTPTIVMRKDGSFWFALGARGGPRIVSAVLQIIINVIDHDMDLQTAMDAPRIHHQWMPDEIVYEPDGMSPATLAILAGYGHRFAAKPDKVAAATGVMVDEKGIRVGAVDRRSDGLPVGY
jgi:gamma-glutamyltranspeptidase/glutathione hydrolase